MHSKIKDFWFSKRQRSRKSDNPMKVRTEIVYTKSSCHNSIVVDNVSNGAMSTRYDMGSIGMLIIC